MGAFDGAVDLAPRLPLTIVRDLVGLGEGGKDHMLGWGAAKCELMGDPRKRRSYAVVQLGALRAFLDDEITLKSSPDGWAQRTLARGLEEGYQRGAAIKLMRDYISPSLDTTISAIGCGLQLFARHPDQWRILRKDRSLIKNAIEEIVWLNKPIRAFFRWVGEISEVAGVEIEKASRLMVIHGAANRDPARFENPDMFDITRHT